MAIHSSNPNPNTWNMCLGITTGWSGCNGTVWLWALCRLLTSLVACSLGLLRSLRATVASRPNLFHWSTVKLNLPGMPSFDPSMPRVYKWNPQSHAIACDCITYVDDTRTVGPTMDLLQRATHQIESRMAYLGLQDATRKRRPASQTPGEWTGTITVSRPGIGLFVTVSQVKWDKAKLHLAWIMAHFDNGVSNPEISLKSLEQKVGFLVIVTPKLKLVLKKKLKTFK